MGGWYSWQKEPRAAHWFFLFQIKKGTSELTKMAILRKKGTLGSQWQSLINSQMCQDNIQNENSLWEKRHSPRPDSGGVMWRDLSLDLGSFSFAIFCSFHSIDHHPHWGAMIFMECFS